MEKESSASAFSLEVEIFSPPNRSLNAAYEIVHDEILGLQALAREELSKAFCDQEGFDFNWLLFVTEPTPYKTIRDGATALAFLKSKIRPQGSK